MYVFQPCLRPNTALTHVFKEMPDLSRPPPDLRNSPAGAPKAAKETSMRMSVVGCGDAWATNGRNHTCFRLDFAGQCVLVDFGATAIAAWNRMGFDPRDVDAICVSHLHGDHFGGIPFFLLQNQYHVQRDHPLTIFGPPGTRSRLQQAIDTLYPGFGAKTWRFEWSVIELEPGANFAMPGWSLDTIAVVHSCGDSPATGIRITAGDKIFAYSGDTEWTPALIGLAAKADLFVVECSSGSQATPGHIDWPTLDANLHKLDAKQVAITHMSESAQARSREIARSGAIVLEDGLILDV